jgi:hypothetical protein
MAEAIRDAGIAKEEIGYINALEPARRSTTPGRARQSKPASASTPKELLVIPQSR